MVVRYREALRTLGAACLLTGCGGEISAPRVPFDAPVTAISAGVLHTCGVTANGAGYCWGWNRDGQVGDGSNRDRPFPVRVSGGLAFAALSGGGGHTCGLTAGGAPHCWGFNLSGQLGAGPVAATVQPVAVSGGLTLAAVDAGGAFTCGVTADSVAYCWGWNARGQLGDGTRDDRNLPTAVGGGLKLIALSAGGVNHTCALGADSTAYCWGANDVGQLGNGTVTDTTRPVAVAGGLRFATLTLGYQHSCGLTAAGIAYCWGDNGQGQLGDSVGSTTAPHAVAGGLTFVALSAGASFTCGVATGGDAYCWGANPNGQLGTSQAPLCNVGGAPIPCSPVPVAVAGGLPFASISAGTQHACGLTTGQRAYCWGLNDQGQLGDGSGRTRASPVLVAGQVP